MTRIDARNVKVTCSDCGREYTCLPWDDYYNSTTLEDGVCEKCLLSAAGLDSSRLITTDSELASRDN